MTDFPPQGFPRFLEGVSTLGNTVGTTGTINKQMVFAGGNNITLSQSINGQSGTITISAFNQSTIPAVEQLNGSSATMSISAGNNISISNNASTINVINVLTSGSNIQDIGSITVAGTNDSLFAKDDHIHRGVFQAQISGNTSNTSNPIYGSLVIAGGNNITLSQVSAAGAATVTISGGAGLVLVSDHLVPSDVSATTFTGANTSDIEYLFHIFIRNGGTAQGTYSILFNNITAGLTREYHGAASSAVSANQDNTPIAFAQTTSLAAHGYISMMMYTNTVGMIAKIQDVRGGTFNIFEQGMLQTHTDATNVTAIVINAGIASGIGSDSRIIWYKKG